MARHVRSVVLALTLLAELLPASLQAQRRPASLFGSLSNWAPIGLGPRVGYDDQSNAMVLGAGVRIPLLPGADVELMPNADVTFLNGLREYEYNLEAVYVLGTRNSGIFAGGGLAWRNTIYRNETTRRTKRGHSFVVGLRSQGRDARFATEFALRWIYVDKDLKPRAFLFGLNFLLW